MQYLKGIIKYDLSKGFTSIRIKLLFGFSIFTTLSAVSALNPSGNGAKTSSVLYFIFMGGEPFNFESMSTFQVPVVWFLCQLLLSIIIGSYPQKELCNSIAFVRSGSRFSWWLSKCIWSTFSVFLFYLLAVLAASIFCALHAFCSFHVMGIDTSVSSTLLNSTNSNELLLTLFSMLMLSSGIAIMQIVLSFIIGSTYSAITVLIFLFISSFFDSPILFAGRLMLARRLPAEGFETDIIINLITAIVIIVMATTAGYYVVKRKDLLLAPSQV